MLTRGNRRRRVTPTLDACRLVLALLLVGLAAAVHAVPAAAHETRDIVGGAYQVRVGFIDEPAYQGLLNGLVLTICSGKCTSNPDGSGTLANGVVGAFETVKVEVIHGGQSMPLPLVAVPRQPGQYHARFVPTRVGDYTFRIHGMIGSDQFDERFTSSPTTFDSVQPATVIQFPDKPGYPTGGTVAPPATAQAAPTAASAPTPAPPAAPSTAVAVEFQVLRAQLQDQQQQLEAAAASAAGASTLALAGLAAGALGILVGLVAVLAGRRSPSPQQPRSESGEVNE
jgi:hypothetical protein